MNPARVWKFARFPQFALGIEIFQLLRSIKRFDRDSAYGGERTFDCFHFDNAGCRLYRSVKEPVIEFLVIGLAIAILVTISRRRASRAGKIFTRILLVLWLVALALGIYDLPRARGRALIFFSPLTLLFFAPFVALSIRRLRNRD